MKGRGRQRLPVMGYIHHGAERHSIGNMVNDIVIVSLVTYGSYTCGEQSIR